MSGSSPPAGGPHPAGGPAPAGSSEPAAGSAPVAPPGQQPAEVVSVDGPVKGRPTLTRLGVRDQQWLLSLLPAFPLLLLVLRLWYLSRQDLQTMLLLVQYVSPLGLLSALMITLVWVPPLAILLARALGALHWASAANPVEVLDSWLVRLSLRMPNWVVAFAVLLALLTWQLRFLPALLLLTLSIIGLTVRGRWPANRWAVRAACVVLPLVVAAAAYTWVLPAGIDAIHAGEAVTAALLLVPPAVAVLFTGPVPAWAARPVTHWTALALGLLAPFALGAVFLRSPILPLAALEVEPVPAAGGSAAPDAAAGTGPGTAPGGGSVRGDGAVSGAGAASGDGAVSGGGSVRGDGAVSGAGTRPAAPAGPTVLRAHVIAVDDRVTILLDTAGEVVFLQNDRIVSQTLCPASAGHGPASRIEVHGWHVERTMLEWLAPPSPSPPADPRCQGRPLRPR